MSVEQRPVRPGEQTGLLRASWRMVIRERCTVCDLRYEASDGAWLGSLALGYGAGALIAGVMSFSQVAWHRIDDLGRNPLSH